MKPKTRSIVKRKPCQSRRMRPDSGSAGNNESVECYHALTICERDEWIDVNFVDLRCHEPTNDGGSLRHSCHIHGRTTSEPSKQLGALQSQNLINDECFRGV